MMSGLKSYILSCKEYIQRDKAEISSNKKSTPRAKLYDIMN